MTEEELFYAALAKPTAERTAFLDQACLGNGPLRAAVEALLAAHEAPGSFLNLSPKPPGANPPGANPSTDNSAATLEHAAPAEHSSRSGGAQNGGPSPTATTVYFGEAVTGVVIAGRYTLQEKIGEGGMGEVWVARQTEPVKRKVALKLIKTGMDSKAVLQRFEQERQALALMDHPHIAQVHDGGTTPTGQPFFVMELVNGLPLTRFCDELKLTPKARLELFVPVCQAVQHAHQKGIVHRDLKPANILVTIIDGKPVPKVIDFGVAKAISGELTEETMSTGFGAVVGTLEYMSPEQAGFSGEDIDTRADIYSLGVILYELLTGLRPIDAKRLKKAALTEMIRIIQEEEPSKPSTRLSTDDSLPSLAAMRRTEPRKLMALLRGELDWVVMKCLEKQRDRRYETANALARDIQRYLADEAVEARPPSAAYRLQKLARRHRAALAVATTFAAVLLIAAGVSTWQAVRATQALESEARQRRLAQRHEREANRQRVKAEASARREAAERGKAERARERAQEAIDSMTSVVAGESLLRQKEISDEQKAFLSSALAYYREFAGERAKDRRSRERIAEAAQRVGVIEVRLGRHKQSLTALEMSRAEAQSLASDFPDSLSSQNFLADAHFNCALVYGELGRKAEAIQSLEQSIALLEKLHRQLPGNPSFRSMLAHGRYNLGVFLREIGATASALAESLAAAKLFEELIAEFPAEPGYALDFAACAHNLAEVRADMGQQEEALELLLATKQRLTKLLDEHPEDADILQSRVRVLQSLGAMHVQLHDLEGARRELSLAMEESKRFHERFPSSFDAQRLLASGHENMGIVYRLLKMFTESKTELDRAQVLIDKLIAQRPEEPKLLQKGANIRLDWGELQFDLGDRLESEKAIEAARRLYQQAADRSPQVVQYQEGLLTSTRKLALSLAVSDPPRAEAVFQSGVKIAKKLAAKMPGGPTHRHIQAEMHFGLATLRMFRGELAEARAEIQAGFDLWRPLVKEHPKWPEFRVGLGSALLVSADLDAIEGDTEGVIAHCDEAIGVLRGALEQDPQLDSAKLFLMNIFQRRAQAHDAKGEFAAASDDWRQSLEYCPANRLNAHRIELAFALLKAGKTEDVLVAAGELEAFSANDPGLSYNLACLCCRLSEVLTEKQQEFADRAMRYLGQAVDSGFADSALMANDPDLNPLRAREEFQRLLKSVVK